jgi:hypothetical protein
LDSGGLYSRTKEENHGERRAVVEINEARGKDAKEEE